MSQQFTTTNALTAITGGDSASVDAFSRWRVSTPQFVFDAQFTYDLQPQIYESITVDPSGASTPTTAFDATNRCVLMTFASAGNNANAYLQSYEYHRYQPGRSQLVFITFNFLSTAANCTKFAGYSDGSNGIELQQVGSTVQFKLYTTTGNSGSSDNTKAQTDWNLDKFNGTGPSGLTLDLTKVQILVIDLQALYAGRVRVGFDVNGNVYWAHQFVHANIVVYPYIANANRPIRCGMLTTAGSVSTTMFFLCASVTSEGGNDLPSYEFTADTGNTAITVAQDNRTHLLSIAPRLTFGPGSVANRVKFDLQSVEGIVTSGSNPIYWELLLGYFVDRSTSTFTVVNSTYSAFSVLAGAPSGSPVLSPTAVTGTATSGTTLTIVKSGGTWNTDQFAGCTVTLTSGAGSGDKSIVVSNSATTLTLATAITAVTTQNFSITNPTDYPIVVASGYWGAAGNANHQPVAAWVKTRAPVTLNKNGAIYNGGVITLVGRGIGGSSPVRAALSWHEDR